MRSHLLFSQESDMPVKWFDKFNKEEIKSSIVKHLKENPNDTLEHCKEFSKEDLRKYVGYEMLGFYEINPKNGKPSRLVERGSKTYYRSL